MSGRLPRDISTFAFSLPFHGEPDVAEQAFIENRVDDGLVIEAALGEPANPGGGSRGVGIHTAVMVDRVAQPDISHFPAN